MIRIIIFVVVLVLILSFFGISLRGVVESPAGQENISYVWALFLVGADLLISAWWNLLGLFGITR